MSTLFFLLFNCKFNINNNKQGNREGFERNASLQQARVSNSRCSPVDNNLTAWPRCLPSVMSPNSSTTSSQACLLPGSPEFLSVSLCESPLRSPVNHFLLSPTNFESPESNFSNSSTPRPIKKMFPTNGYESVGATSPRSSLFYFYLS